MPPRGGAAQFRSSSESGIPTCHHLLDRTAFSEMLIRSVAEPCGKASLMTDRKVCIADLLNSRTQSRARSSEQHLDFADAGHSYSPKRGAPAALALVMAPPSPAGSATPELKGRPHSIMARRTFSLLPPAEQPLAGPQRPAPLRPLPPQLQQQPPPALQRQALRSPSCGGGPLVSIDGASGLSRPSGSLQLRPPPLPRTGKALLSDCPGLDSARSSARRGEAGTPASASSSCSPVSPDSFLSENSRSSSKQSICSDPFGMGNSTAHFGPRSILRKPSTASAGSSEGVEEFPPRMLSRPRVVHKKVKFAKDVKAPPPASITDLLKLVRATSDDGPPTPPPLRCGDLGRAAVEP
mmetsp:Transcript_49591/g.160327  ORF Transcript_49591/g.160327 Transcript_49591/m.160327 type:complete len:352 (-) Transcript_49591:469-1524(-)